MASFHDHGKCELMEPPARGDQRHAEVLLDRGGRRADVAGDQRVVFGTIDPGVRLGLGQAERHDSGGRDQCGDIPLRSIAAVRWKMSETSCTIRGSSS